MPLLTSRGYALDQTGHEEQTIGLGVAYSCPQRHENTSIRALAEGRATEHFLPTVYGRQSDCTAFDSI